jgi:hypothetical protein
MMTLNRYLLIGKDHSEWLVTLAKLEFKRVIQGSLLFTALINIGHGWQYTVSDDINNIDTDAYNERGIKINYPIPNQSQVYLIYSIVCFVLNFCAFLILNTGIEVKIVRRMHKELKEKRQRITHMKSLNESVSSAQKGQIDPQKSVGKDKEAAKEDDRKERKVITMVVVNSIFNFFLRAPEILFFIENQTIWHSIYVAFGESFAQTMSGFSNMITDLGYFGFILTFSTNFVIYSKFNSKFREVVVLFKENSKKN